MDSRNRKRKHNDRSPRSRRLASRRPEAVEKPPAIDPGLYIQAHEADIVRGPQAWDAARSLEVKITEENGKRVVRPGSALIQWKPSRGQNDVWEEDEYMSLVGKDAEREQEQDSEGIWVDRYDARLLLDTLPEAPPASTISPPGSPSGWSDLPSDAEDTFFFSRAEADDFRREKRRRLIDQSREERLRALHAEAGEDDDGAPAERWGGSDEEPDDAQRELMRRTAAHILGSPNPAQLELRILANHGADARFAFLRGRWARAWRTAKGRARLEKEQEGQRRAAAAKPASALGGLAGYGDSDAEDSEKTDVAASAMPSGDAEDASAESAEEAAKRARRERAREWAEKRRAVKDAAVEDNAT
ncbi:hypothetical protein OBBRIDRAFT_784227 [Obba rivulosa]|uniref:SURP motif domain-containing protein n=1 Tax=Obba rivulosa TaxID=1052685 RepID=A0A8E2DGE2_9APHY|nr:hypothetical protein OBBRIDRAFT_784227 [Obba rivulosa]